MADCWTPPSCPPAESEPPAASSIARHARLVALLHPLARAVGAGMVVRLHAHLHHTLPVARAQRAQLGAERPGRVRQASGTGVVLQPHRHFGLSVQQVGRAWAVLDRLVEQAGRVDLAAGLLVR
jgi:hypothetical protein